MACPDGFAYSRAGLPPRVLRGVMRVVILSEDGRSVSVLTAAILDAGHLPVAVVCPRAKGDDGRDATPGQRRAARALVNQVPGELDLVYPARRSQLAELLGWYEADSAVAAGFSWRVPNRALTKTRYGIVNAHPSLLPRYRGPEPIGQALISGDTQLGVTVHRMTDAIDAGPILAQKAIGLADADDMEALATKLDACTHELERDRWIDRSCTRELVQHRVRTWHLLADVGAFYQSDEGVVEVLEVSRTAVGGHQLDCADGPIWITRSVALRPEQSPTSRRPPSNAVTREAMPLTTEGLRSGA